MKIYGSAKTQLSPTLFSPDSKNIFVFGSNLGGIHGAGAARFANRFCGASFGAGIGWVSNSFAIPTKDQYLKVLEISDIQSSVDFFVSFAKGFEEINPDWNFYITPIGTGLAGYSHLDMAVLFVKVRELSNCYVCQEWFDIIQNTEVKIC